MKSPTAARLVAIGLVLAVSVVAVAPPSSAEAATVAFTFAPGGTGGTIGTIGVDAIYGGAGGGGAYDARYLWRPDGGLNVELADFRPGRSVSSIEVPGSPDVVRLELYPKPERNCPPDASQPCFFVGYDPWRGNVGGVHIERRTSDGPGWLSVQGVRLPIEGVGGAFRIEGAIASATPVPDGRVQVDLFQYDPCGAHDPCPAAPRTANGVVQGAFATSTNRGLRWTGSVGWPGRYVVFVRDTITRRHVQGFMDLAPGRIPTIDLDAVCFGLATCRYDTGAPAVPAGGFHPVSPTRILDTRLGLGIANGPVRTGDGRSTSANTAASQDAIANHELKVTGVAGIPATGVSAVLLNVTAVDPPGAGYLTVFPRPPAIGEIWNDQSTFLFPPSSSNLNMRPGETVPNMVLARVGAGGRIRLLNSTWPMHVVADVAGWFDTGGSSSGGFGFTGVAPTRIVDTRSGLGGIGGRFAPGESRSIQIAGVGGVPPDARSVVVNITAASPSGVGYVTAYPDGTTRPNASNLNLHPGQDRPNLAVVRIGVNGRIRLAVAETSTELIVDVFGYYGPGGGRTTAVEPTRVFDTRSGLGSSATPLGPGETRRVQIAGRGGVPSNATAVVVNVTAAATTSSGYLSIWPNGGTRPTVSSLNWTAARDVPNLAMVRLGEGGSISVFNAAGTTHLIVDVMGFVTG